MIFISYRRDDTAGYARALYDALARRFGAGRVFIDVDDIGAGQPFADVIGAAVGGSQVLLVLIGPRWRGVRPDGSARIDDPDDFVRREVATGLARGMRVIPLLLDGAPLPQPLPPDLQALATRNALTLDAAGFAAGVERLAASLGPDRRRAWLGAAALGLAAAAAGAAWWRWSPRPAVNGDWQADVTYDWGARHAERLRFEGQGADVRGSVSFLRVPRPIAEGRIESGVLHFSTRTEEVAGAETRTVLHRYTARLVDGELQVTLQTEGGFSAHPPLRFVARRVPER